MKIYGNDPIIPEGSKVIYVKSHKRHPKPVEMYHGKGVLVVGCGKTKRDWRKTYFRLTSYHQFDEFKIVSGHVCKACVFPEMHYEFVFKIREYTEEERAMSRGMPCDEYEWRTANMTKTSKEAKLWALRLKKGGFDNHLCWSRYYKLLEQERKRDEVVFFHLDASSVDPSKFQQTLQKMRVLWKEITE